MQVTTQVQNALEVIACRLDECKLKLEDISCDTSATKDLAQGIEALNYDAHNLARQYRCMQELIDLFNKHGWELELCLYKSEYSYSIWLKDHPACKIEGLLSGIPSLEDLQQEVSDARWERDALDLMTNWMARLCDDYDLNSLDVQAIKTAALLMEDKLPCLLTDIAVRKGGIPCR